jgi:hypothetical protein
MYDMLADCCLVMHSMRLQNDTIVKMLQELDDKLSQTREADPLRRLWADIQFAKSLAKKKLIVGKAAAKARMVSAMFGLMGKHGIIKSSTEL